VFEGMEGTPLSSWDSERALSVHQHLKA